MLVRPLGEVVLGFASLGEIGNTKILDRKDEFSSGEKIFCVRQFFSRRMHEFEHRSTSFKSSIQPK